MRVYKSPRPDIDLPRIDLLTLLFDSEWCLANESTKIHLAAADPSNHITKSSARLLVRRIAYLLRHRYGIGATRESLGKDVVLAVSSGNPFIPCFFYSVVAAGGVFCGASTSFRVAEMAQQIRDSDAKVLVCTAEHEAVMVEAAARCGMGREKVLVLDWETPERWGLLAGDDRRDVLAETGGREMDWTRITDQRELEATTICLLYSSGTTGLPKGVRISHWAILASCICTMDPARRYQERCQREGREPFTFDTIAHLPMANIAGIDLYSSNPFYMGGSTYWMEKYDFDSFIEYQRRYRPAYQFSVPPIWLRIAKSEKVTDHFDGLHIAVTGSAPIGYATARDVRHKLGKGKAYMAQTWGVTEASGVITALDWHPDTTKDEVSWSVGELCPNVRLRIVDDDDRDVEPGSPGEMLIGGPILAQEYHCNPAATRDAFTADGWFRTGDIGVIRDDLIYIVDRKKELIKYKGNQVAPAEIEALLTSHPRIADAAVIGVWDPTQETEVPRGYVVAKQGAGEKAVEEAEVQEFVRQSMADHKRLRGGVVFLSEIPKSASGKILRKDLRVLAGQGVKAKL